jgi:hypothetical protein
MTGGHKIILYRVKFRHNEQCRSFRGIRRLSHLLLALTQNLVCYNFKDDREVETFAISCLVTRCERDFRQQGIVKLVPLYRGAGKSLARLGRKQATATEYF